MVRDVESSSFETTCAGIKTTLIKTIFIQILFWSAITIGTTPHACIEIEDTAGSMNHGRVHLTTMTSRYIAASINHERIHLMTMTLRYMAAIQQLICRPNHAALVKLR